MKKATLIFLFLFLLASIASAQETLIVCLEMTENSMASNCVDVLDGEPDEYLAEYDSSYKANVYSFKGEILTTFNFEKIVDFYNEETGEQEELEDTISFPYYKNVNKLEILDGRKVALSVDLSEYAKCNENNICDAEETIEDCPEECKEEEPTQVTIIQPVKEETSTATYVIIIIIGIIIFFLFLYLIRKKKSKA